ncbi:unnamed protein product [Brassica rapa subsp. trilocularis]
MASPVPITHPSCLTKRSLPINTLLQPCEVEDGAVHLRNGSVLQYFPNRQRANRHEGFRRMRQPSFASSASLKESACGILKQDIEWDGIGARTLLIITIFPAPDKRLEDQLTALCLILSTTEAKTSFFFLPNSSGSPRRTWCRLQIRDG